MSYFSPTPFCCQGNSDAASGGASGSVYVESSKATWFSEVPGAQGLAQEGRGGEDGDRKRGDLNGTGGRLVAGCCRMVLVGI